MKTYLRALAGVLVALCTLTAHAAQTLFPNEPTLDSGSFYVKADAYVTLCTSGSGCGAVKVVRAGSPTQMTNCAALFGVPADGTHQCDPFATATPPPPLVTPPVVTPPVVTPPVVVAPQPFQSCYPPPDIQYTVTMVGFTVVPTGFVSKNYWKVDVSPEVSSTYTGFAMWKDTCTGNVTGQFYNLSSLAKLLVAYTMQQLGSSDAINAWAKAQPVEALSATEAAFKTATLATANVVTPPAPVVTWWVSPIAASTRPFYATNSAGTAVGKKLGDVAVKTACDQSKRLGTTNYYLVPSVGGYSICAAAIN